MRSADRAQARSMLTALHRSVVAGLSVLTLIVVVGAVPAQIAQTHV